MPLPPDEDIVRAVCTDKWDGERLSPSLDVVNKTRNNIFGWRGQFTPEFVAARGLRAISQTRILLP